MILARPAEYLITYQNSSIQVLPKRHPQARRRRSLPVPNEMVDMVKDDIPSALIPEYIKAVYLFKVPKYTVLQSKRYVETLVQNGATMTEALFTSLLVAHKLHHDLVIRNATWAKHTPVACHLLNKWERVLYADMNYQVYLR